MKNTEGINLTIRTVSKMSKLFIPILLLTFFSTQEKKIYVNAATLVGDEFFQLDSPAMMDLTRNFKYAQNMLEKEKSIKCNEYMYRVDNDFIPDNPYKDQTIACLELYNKKIPDYCMQADLKRNDCIDAEWKTIKSKYEDFYKTIAAGNLEVTMNRKLLKQYTTLITMLMMAATNVRTFCVQQSENFMNDSLLKQKDEFNKCDNHFGSV